MSLAAETREAVRQRPFLLDALRAGVVNYTAAAAFLGLDGDAESIATALRRYAADLPAHATDARDTRVTMQSGVGLQRSAGTTSPVDDDGPVSPADDAGPADDVGPADAAGPTDTAGPADAERGGDSTADEAAPLLSVAGTAVVPDAGSLTAVLATGEVDAAALAAVLDRLRIADVSVDAAGVAEDTLLVVVPRRAGAKTVRLVEAAVDAVPA